MAGINLSLRTPDAKLVFNVLRAWLKPGEVVPWSPEIEEALRDVAMRLREQIERKGG